MIRSLLVVVLLSHAALADDTFEARAQAAQRVKRLENLVWSLTAACDAGDDTQRRQCKHVRDARAAELTGATLLVDADADAFDVSAWSPQKKSVALTLSSCIRCGGVEVDGKTWYLTGAAPAFEGGKVTAARLWDSARTFDSEAAATTWTKSVAKVRVQLLVKLAAKARWTQAEKNGLAFDIVGYRVFTPCDGAVLAASPASGPVAADKKQCVQAPPAPAAEAPKGPVVDLTPVVIRDAMKPVSEAADKCFDHYGVTGKATLRITVVQDGSVAKYEQQGDFVDTPTGQCIDKAMQGLTFPHAKKPKTSFTFPLQLK